MIVLRPQGKLDVLGSALFKQQVERVSNFASDKQKVWIVDLGEVESINHFGLTALMGARRTALNKGAKLLLRNVDNAVYFILEIAQLLDYFDFADSANDDSNLEPISPQDVPSDLVEDDGEELTFEANDKVVNAAIEDQSTADAISNLQKIIANMRTKLK